MRAAHLAARSRIEQDFDRTVSAPFGPFLAAGELLYQGPWVAERLAEFGGFLASNPDSILPVIRTILESGARYSRGRCVLRRASTGGAAGRGLPTLARHGRPGATGHRDHVHRRTGAGRPDRSEHQTRSLHALRKPARPVRGGGPGRADRGRPAGGADGPRARAGRRQGPCRGGGTHWHAGVFARLVVAGDPGLPIVVTSTTSSPTTTPPATASPTTTLLAVVGHHLAGQPAVSTCPIGAATLAALTETAPIYRLLRVGDANPVPGPGRRRVRRCRDRGRDLVRAIRRTTGDSRRLLAVGLPGPGHPGRRQHRDRLRGRRIRAHRCHRDSDITEFGGWRNYLAAQAAPALTH